MLLFNNFKWFSQRLLEIAKQQEWKDAQRELESKIARNPARRSEVECPIYESYIFLDELQANNTSHSYYFFNMKKKNEKVVFFKTPIMKSPLPLHALECTILIEKEAFSYLLNSK
jgi:hypothetical protein